jgi:hypothetical protein
MHEVIPQHAIRQLNSPAHTDNSNDNWERKTDATPTAPTRIHPQYDSQLPFDLDSCKCSQIVAKKLDILATKFILLNDFPASEFSVPTFRNTLFVSSS